MNGDITITANDKMSFKTAEMFIRSMHSGLVTFVYAFVAQASSGELDDNVRTIEVSDETAHFVKAMASVVINLPGHDELTGENFLTYYFIAPNIFRLKIKNQNND